MRGSIGQLLIQQGIVDAGALADALSRQSGKHPVASELYALGYATERQLVTALSVQTGWSGIVLDESTLRLDVLEYVSVEWARVCSALVVHEDETNLIVVAARPEEAIAPARELGAERGKTVELRIALEITLARTIRVAFKRWKAGELFLVGPESERTGAYLAVVHRDGSDDEHRRAQRALAEEAARKIENTEDLPSEELSIMGTTLMGDWHASTITTTTEHDLLVEDETQLISDELDRGVAVDLSAPGRPRVLIVDPEAAGRTKLLAELERLDYECQWATTGPQAVQLMSQSYFDLVFADLATPDLDGLKMCRAVKHSRRLSKVRVIVTTSVVDSGQILDDVLHKHGADGYLEKPLDTRRLHRLLRDLSIEERSDHEALLAEALAAYHSGDIEGAITKLQSALGSDPASPKLHFMLANMLQRADRWAEAIDEYEAVVDLQPTYFPALTRLAYLYFRQGLHARAVETWRRALPVCEDQALRHNIELFMRKLVADMARTDPT